MAVSRVGFDSGVQADSSIPEVVITETLDPEGVGGGDPVDGLEAPDPATFWPDDPFGGPSYPTGSGVGVGVGGGGAGGGGGPVSPPQTSTVEEPKEVAAKPPQESVDAAKLTEYLKSYPKEFRDKVQFNPNLKDAYGKTGVDKDGKLVVQIGPEALKSPALLKSTLDHEQKHVEQARSGNYRNSASVNSVTAEAVNDLEAYRTELTNARKNGLSPEEINRINKDIQINEALLKRLDPEYYERVKRGDYSLRPDDRVEIKD